MTGYVKSLVNFSIFLKNINSISFFYSTFLKLIINQFGLLLWMIYVIFLLILVSFSFFNRQYLQLCLPKVVSKHYFRNIWNISFLYCSILFSFWISPRILEISFLFFFLKLSVLCMIFCLPDFFFLFNLGSSFMWSSLY